MNDYFVLDKPIAQLPTLTVLQLQMSTAPQFQTPITPITSASTHLMPNRDTNTAPPQANAQTATETNQSNNATNAAVPEFDLVTHLFGDDDLLGEWAFDGD